MISFLTQTIYQMTMSNNESAVLECKSSGDPPPKVTWRDATNTELAHNPTTLRRGPSAHFYPALMELQASVDANDHADVKIFTCEADNQMGRAKVYLEITRAEIGPALASSVALKRIRSDPQASRITSAGSTSGGQRVATEFMATMVVFIVVWMYI